MTIWGEFGWESGVLECYYAYMYVFGCVGALWSSTGVHLLAFSWITLYVYLYGCLVLVEFGVFWCLY